MAKRKTEVPVSLSVLDRVIDNDLSRPSLTRRESLKKLQASVMRDLEWLLNSRQTIEETPELAEEIRHSLYHYGIPDVCSFSLRSAKDQSRILRAIEAAITDFEPRLFGAKVSLKPLDQNTHKLHFLIEGLLRVEPAPQRVVFDTVLEISSGKYEVKGEGGA